MRFDYRKHTKYVLTVIWLECWFEPYSGNSSQRKISLCLQFEVFLYIMMRAGQGTGHTLSSKTDEISPQGVHWPLHQLVMGCYQRGWERGPLLSDFCAACPCDKAHKRKRLGRKSTDLWFSLLCPHRPHFSSASDQMWSGEHDPILLQ